MTRRGSGGQILARATGETVQPQAQHWLERLQGVASPSWTAPASSRAATGRRAPEHPEGGNPFYWQKLILCRGAGIVFTVSGLDVARVVGPGGLQALVKTAGRSEANEVAVAGSGPLLLAVADG